MKVAAPPPPAFDPEPLSGGMLVMGTLALSLATFMNVLDSSIANVSLPAIAGDLGVSPGQGTWVITSFGVANAISVPLTGWLTLLGGADFFLNYNYMPIRMEAQNEMHATGIFLIEIGVAICVMMTIINLLDAIVKRGEEHGRTE